MQRVTKELKASISNRIARFDEAAKKYGPHAAIGRHISDGSPFSALIDAFDRKDLLTLAEIEPYTISTLAAALNVNENLVIMFARRLHKKNIDHALAREYRQTLN